MWQVSLNPVRRDAHTNDISESARGVDQLSGSHPSGKTLDAPTRFVSVDAYRGFVMFLMLAGGLFRPVAEAFPDAVFWQFLAYHQSHVPWVGCSLHDLIQPGFSFLVGTAMTFSVARRAAQGQDAKATTGHAISRAVFLVLLGLFISSLDRRPLVFDDTLTQIGLAYLPAYALSFRSGRDLWIAFWVILAGYWAAFAMYPLPGPSFDYARVGVSPDWLQANGLHGFAAHWQKNSNPGWEFDVLFLNHLPREGEYVGLGNGLVTLNFIPLIGTMILGVVAGRVIRSDRSPWTKVEWFVIAGIIGILLGLALGALGICPVVKAIWTPSWVLFSGGWCFLFLAAFFVAGEIFQAKSILFPFVVLGVNSIAAYCISHFHGALTYNILRHIVGSEPFLIFGKAYEALLYNGACLILVWLFLYFLYRQRIFIRI